MDLFDRIYRMHALLRRARYPVPRATLENRLECSRATVKRILREMRDKLGAPIDYDRRHNGYRYLEREGQRYELPGLWFSASELHALLACQQLLGNIQPGLLDEHLAPLRARIEGILVSSRVRVGEVARRVRILSMTARCPDAEHFGAAAGAVLQRKRLHIRYHGRASDETSEREISPQRLTHYRDNWYLDAWDHGKKALRSFSVDRLLAARAIDKPARDIPDSRLDAHFASSYGIFAGRPKHRAVLRFTPGRARWVAHEQWHPQQRGRFEPDGSYVLEVPYGDDRELVLDILKYGPEVEVIAPPSLRREVAQRLRLAAQRYRDTEKQR